VAVLDNQAMLLLTGPLRTSPVSDAGKPTLKLRTIRCSEPLTRFPGILLHIRLHHLSKPKWPQIGPDVINISEAFCSFARHIGCDPSRWYRLFLRPNRILPLVIKYDQTKLSLFVIIGPHLVSPRAKGRLTA
jgi:hypothetical protein